MAENKDSLELFLEDGEYDGDEGGVEALEEEGSVEEGGEECEDEGVLDNEDGGVSRYSSLYSQQWPQSYR